MNFKNKLALLSNAYQAFHQILFLLCHPLSQVCNRSIVLQYLLWHLDHLLVQTSQAVLVLLSGLFKKSLTAIHHFFHTQINVELQKLSLLVQVLKFISPGKPGRPAEPGLPSRESPGAPACPGNPRSPFLPGKP